MKRSTEGLTNSRNENRILNIRTITLKKFFLSSKENFCVRLLKTQKSTVIWDLKKLLDHIHEIQQKNQNNVKLRYKLLWWRKHWCTHLHWSRHWVCDDFLFKGFSFFPILSDDTFFAKEGLSPWCNNESKLKIFRYELLKITLFFLQLTKWLAEKLPAKYRLKLWGENL